MEKKYKNSVNPLVTQCFRKLIFVFYEAGDWSEFYDFLEWWQWRWWQQQNAMQLGPSYLLLATGMTEWQTLQLRYKQPTAIIPWRHLLVGRFVNICCSIRDVQPRGNGWLRFRG